MRITLLAHGTRGDNTPLISLGAALVARDHDVTMMADAEFAPLVEAAGLRCVPLALSLTAHVESPAGQRLLRLGGLRLVHGLQRWHHAHAAVLEDATLRACEGAEAIVSQHFPSEHARAIADRDGVPLALAFFWPWWPTGDFPSWAVTHRRLPGRRLRRGTHHLAQAARWSTERAYVAGFRRRLGLPPSASVIPRQQAVGGLCLHPFSPNLLPPPADWGPHVHVTGAWRLPEAVRAGAGEGLPGELEAWLAAGDAPVYLGFGSMPVLDPPALLATIGRVTARLGVRAVVAGRGLEAAEAPAHVQVVTGAVDHDRLLPRCRAAVHHGGAGTTAATARAGLPTLVCSVWGDQPFWGALVARRGVGAHVPFRRLDERRLDAGLRRLLRPDVAARARALGAAIRAEEDGATRGAALLEDWLVTAPGPDTTKGGPEAALREGAAVPSGR